MRCGAPEMMELFYSMMRELSTFLTIFPQKSFSKTALHPGEELL